MKVNAQTLKYIGGALIVAAAAVIMLPGFLPVIMGVWKLLVVLVVCGGSALAIAYATMFIKRKKNQQVKE